MTEEPRTFSQARARLEEIVTQVRKKDTSLEKSLDLLEEGVKLANQCTELIDHADWEDAGGESPVADDEESSQQATGAPQDAADAPHADVETVSDDGMAAGPAVEAGTD